MRGAERPAKVRWSHPFLPPLKALSDDAAWETFVDIADDSHTGKDMDELLRLTDNMPLAVHLIAHLVDYEGCSNVLARWENERTALLSNGFDKNSSLDASIGVSLSSPRITPEAKELLSLLSILPDGLSDVELCQSNLPIRNILACKGTLLCTSLAYMDDAKRLKSLAPIREYIQSVQPPNFELIRPIRTHFQLLLRVYQKYRGTLEMGERTNQITSNLGNLHQVLLRGLDTANPDLTEAISCTVNLSSFRRLQGYGRTDLMDRLPTVFPRPCDHKLEAQFITEMFDSSIYSPIADAEALIDQAVSHFAKFNDPLLECEFFSPFCRAELYLMDHRKSHVLEKHRMLPVLFPTGPDGRARILGQGLCLIHIRR